MNHQVGRQVPAGGNDRSSDGEFSKGRESRQDVVPCLITEPPTDGCACFEVGAHRAHDGPSFERPSVPPEDSDHRSVSSPGLPIHESRFVLQVFLVVQDSQEVVHASPVGLEVRSTFEHLEGVVDPAESVE